MEAIQVDFVGREIIKPSIPTPPCLATHHLSVFDQVVPHVYIPLLFFYPAVNGFPPNPARSLKDSLSATLSRYYPFAGRVKSPVSLDCKDEGVTFVEAKTRFKLLDVLKKPKHEDLDQLFPDGLPWKDYESGPLLAIQITSFACGGITIGFCLSHKLGDMSTMVAFVIHFASIARTNGREEPPSPHFDAALLFPQGDLPPIDRAPLVKTSVLSRRFVFSASKISALKSMVSPKVENPTAVEVVSALIFKAAISASSRSSVPSNGFLFCQAVNLRTRVEPSLPQSCAGNMVFSFPISAKSAEIELWSLVVEMKSNFAHFCEAYAKKYRSESEWLPCIKKSFEESKKLLRKSNQKVYRCSSWRRFGMYEADFGWGKPRWVTVGGFVNRNTILMMDGENGDGMEALVSLEEEDMAAFEVDEEILSYASLNPTIKLN